MKKFGLKKLLGSVFVFGLSLSLAGTLFAEDRLVIKDSSSNTVMAVTEWGQIGLGDSVSGPSGVLDLGGEDMYINGNDSLGYPRLLSIADGRVSFGYLGGTGGGSFEADSASLDSNKKGDFAFIYGGGAFGDLVFTHDDPTAATRYQTTLLVDYRGYIGIGGETTPDYPIQHKSGGYFTGTQWMDASSRDYKENITELSTEEAMEAFKDLTPVKYNYKAIPDEETLGFIAEDVPDLVATNGRKALSAMDTVAVLTKVLQQQQETIEKLNSKIEALEGRIK